MGRRNFLIILAYDGTDFTGWQREPGKRSVQGAVEDALGKVLGTPTEVVGAGRTDAGVHAEGQAASFHAHTALAPGAIKTALNAAFPGDLACRSCAEVDPRFHARFRAKSKLYRYRLQVGEAPDPFARRYSLRVEVDLDLDAMRETGRALAGTRDFRAVTNAKGPAEATRRLDEVRVEANAGFVDLYFSGEGFLYNQVRIMAAILLEAGRGRLSPARAVEILEGRDRAAAPGALGPYGLCLIEVRY